MKIRQIIRDGIEARINRWAYGDAKAVTVKEGHGLMDPRFNTIFGGSSAEKLNDAFKQLPIVRAAITAKARNIAQVPFVLTRTGSDDVLDERDPMVQLFQDVNPYSSQFDLWELIVMRMDGWGDAPVFLDQENERAPGIPMFLWPEDPTKVTPALRNNVQIGWLLNAGRDQRFFLNDETILPKYANPYSKIRGLSKLSALALTNKGDWGAIRYNELVFENGISPGIVFQTPTGSNLTDTQYERLQKELIADNTGVNQAHNAIILEGGLVANDTRKTNRDMQYIDLRKFNREDVAMVEGTPKAELQLYEDMNYATAQSADSSFWKKTLIPLMGQIEAEFNTSFLTPRGYHGHFDVTQIDVLNAEILEKASASKVYIDMGYTINQVNERMNLGFPEVPWGDEPLFSQGYLPPVEESPKSGSLSDRLLLEFNAKETIDGISEIHRKKWLKITQKIQPEVGRTSADVKAYFKGIEKKILARLIKGVGENIRISAKAEDDFGWLKGLFDDSELGRIVDFRQRKAAELGIETVLDEAPATLTVTIDPDPVINQIISSRGGKKIADINARASQYMVKKLQGILKTGVDEGLTEQQLADNIAKGMKNGMQNVIRRSRTIARTEVHGAYAQSRHIAIESTNPKDTQWISTHDDKVRESHEDIDGELKSEGDPNEYSNGLRYPLDFLGPPEEVINCRCAEVAVYEE